MKLWEKTASARTIGMPNNEGMQRQPPPGEVGGAKLLIQVHLTPLTWPRGGQKSSNSKTERQQCIMPLPCSLDTKEFKEVSFFPPYGPIM